jgi:uncharacterized membrane protein YfcA
MNAAADALLFVGALAGGFVSGLAGFGMGLMALGIWLYVLPPSLAVPLVLVCSVIAQSATLPSMWRTFDLTLIWPVVAGGLAGVPIGTMLVARADPQIFRLSVGVLLLLFPIALYLQKKPMAFRLGGRPADAGIGFVGGILGGLAGLSGPLPILWASVRGWGKEQRRGVFQIFNLAILLTALCLHAAAGMVGPQVAWLTLLVFPGAVIGAWLGARIFHALSDRNFRDIVLALLFLSGVVLVWNSI